MSTIENDHLALQGFNTKQKQRSTTESNFSLIQFRVARFSTINKRCPALQAREREGSHEAEVPQVGERAGQLAPGRSAQASGLRQEAIPGPKHPVRVFTRFVLCAIIAGAARFGAPPKLPGQSVKRCTVNT